MPHTNREHGHSAAWWAGASVGQAKGSDNEPVLRPSATKMRATVFSTSKATVETFPAVSNKVGPSAVGRAGVNGPSNRLRYEGGVKGGSGKCTACDQQGDHQDTQKRPIAQKT
jgi:hypothetical protein